MGTQVIFGAPTQSGATTMKSFLVLAVVLVAVAHGSTLDLDTEWENFQVRFDRKFAAQEEHDFRQAIFNENLKFIQKHNAEYALGLHTYTVGINKLADMTREEIAKQYRNTKTQLRENVLNEVEDVDITTLPKSIDWRTKGAVTPVKDQNPCGTCWAFASVVTLEGAHFKKTGKLVSLSEQNLVECIPDKTCSSGGFLTEGIDYAVNNGIDTEESYPYNTTKLIKGEKCDFKKADIGATFTKRVHVAQGSEASLQEAIGTVGPVAVAIDAGLWSFTYYNSGVYNPGSECSTTRLNHGVAAVGYGTTEDGQEYYIVKNSWGSDWGEEGYIKIARNQGNTCGIATDANYAIA